MNRWSTAIAIEGGLVVDNGDRDKFRTLDAIPIQSKYAIPTSSISSEYANDLDRYLDQLLDEALEETFPASDSLAVPTRRELEKNDRFRRS